jgi:hypothetical protein
MLDQTVAKVYQLKTDLVVWNLAVSYPRLLPIERNRHSKLSLCWRRMRHGSPLLALNGVIKLAIPRMAYTILIYATCMSSHFPLHSYWITRSFLLVNLTYLQSTVHYNITTQGVFTHSKILMVRTIIPLLSPEYLEERA